MRIAVIGATGGIGTEVTRQALAAGHEVVAPVRRPDRMTVSGTGLSVERADVLDTDQLLPLLKETDAVVSALGQRPGDRAGIVAGGARAVVPAMRAAGVSRLLVVSAEGAFTNPTDGPLVRFVLKPIVARVFRAGRRPRPGAPRPPPPPPGPRRPGRPAPPRYRPAPSGATPPPRPGGPPPPPPAAAPPRTPCPGTTGAPSAASPSASGRRAGTGG